MKKNVSDFKVAGVFLCPPLVYPLLVCLIYLALGFPAKLVAGSDYTAPGYLDYTPFEIRDQNLFNLIHGQASPGNARLLGESQSLFGSSLVITNTLNVESINTATHSEAIYLDYEAYRLNLSYQYAVSKRWNIKFEVPIIHQSGGIFDSAINDWHQFWGLPLGKRPLVENNQYDVRYAYQSQAAVQLNEASLSLADIQIASGHTLIDSSTTALSFWAALKLPTGNESKLSGSGATDISAWLAVNQQLASYWLINLNAGIVLPGDDSYQNIPLSDHVLYGHIMLAWLTTDSISLKLQLQGHTSYYDKSQLSILGDTLFLSFGGAYNISSCQQLDFAFSEDIIVDASPDASMLISWRSFLGQC
jgi:hypothetical protein